MYQLLIELKDFSAAHRLIKGYKGKCNHLHGHNYALRIVLTAESLGSDDLVIDFSVARKICNEWVQHNMDHCTLVYSEDKPLIEFLQRESQKHYVFFGNTTVECLAKEIYCRLDEVIIAKSAEQQQKFFLQHVELWESSECGVIYAPTTTELKGQYCGQ